MNTLIDPLKRIARDLVDKKLWPVAVALLAAIVAVPILIGGGASSEDTPAPAALAATASTGAGSKSLVTVVDQAVTGKDSRPGRVDDPFYDPPAPPEPETASGGSAGDAGKAEQSTGTGQGGTPAPATPQPSAPVVAPQYYRTVVRWSASEDAKPRPLARLTPLGGLVDTAALYLGVTKSEGLYAVFLLGPNATSEGEGRCESETCRVIGLKSGQKQLITVQPADGGEPRQFYLQAVSVKAVTTGADEARTMRVKVHPDGRDVMREIWSDAPTAEALGPIQYDRDRGLLFKSSAATTPATAATAAKASE